MHIALIFVIQLFKMKLNTQGVPLGLILCGWLYYLSHCFYNANLPIVVRYGCLMRIQNSMYVLKPCMECHVIFDILWSYGNQ